MTGAVTPAPPTPSLGLGGYGEDLPRWIEKEFDRRAMLPRFGVLVVLLAGALADYGHGHRAGHWFVLLAYGLATLGLGAGSRSGSVALARRLPIAATCIDAAIAVYMIADHIPHAAAETRLATDAVSRLPAFLFLLQTGFRLRPGLVLAFAGLVATGWSATVVLAFGVPGLTPDEPSFALRQGLGIAAFLAASAFVFYASSWMRAAAASTLRAWEERLVLSRFLPAGLASEVVRPGGTGSVKERHATLLSVDLRGSSALAQTYSPREIVDWLLGFRRLVHDAVTAHGGIVDKYIGDGVLALFLTGDPRQQAEQALASVAAVFAALRELNHERERRAEPLLRAITAVHCGKVLAGVFDDGRRAEFTVLGPCMNDLSRIERRAKQADCDAVASAEVLAELPPAERERVLPTKLSLLAQASALPELFALAIMSGPPPSPASEAPVEPRFG